MLLDGAFEPPYSGGVATFKLTKRNADGKHTLQVTLDGASETYSLSLL